MVRTVLIENEKALSEYRKRHDSTLPKSPPRPNRLVFPFTTLLAVALGYDTPAFLRPHVCLGGTCHRQGNPHWPDWARYLARYRLHQIINDPKAEGPLANARVTAAFRGGSADIPSSSERIDKFTDTLTQQYGVKLYPTIAELCKNVDATA